MVLASEFLPAEATVAAAPVASMAELAESMASVVVSMAGMDSFVFGGSFHMATLVAANFFSSRNDYTGARHRGKTNSIARAPRSDFEGGYCRTSITCLCY